jgi:PAS domain S-box-containing protein
MLSALTKTARSATPRPAGKSAFVVERTAPGRVWIVGGLPRELTGIAASIEELARRCLDAEMPVEEDAETSGQAPVIWHVTLIPDPERPGTRALGMAVDVTPKRREIERLRETEMFFRAVLRDQAELVCRYLPDMTFVFANDAYAASFGTVPEELVGRPVLPLLPAEERETFLRRLSTVAPEQPITRYEMRIVGPDGLDHWRLWTTRGLFDAHGDLICYQSVGTDITQIKRMQTLLTESRDLFRLALDAARDGIVDWNLEADQVWYSPRWKALLGYRDQDLPNESATWTRLILPEDLPRGLKLLRGMVEGGRDAGTTLRFRHKDGEVRHLLVRAISVNGPEGKPRRLVGAYTDVTQMMEARRALMQAKEEAERANRAKSVFLAMMSHELRTPLNAIIGFSELIEQEAFGPLGSPVYQDYAADILTSGRHLLGTINDILELAGLEAGGTELDLQPVSADRLLNEAARAHAREAAAAGIEIAVEAAPALPALLVDQPRMARALANLLSNAVKFTPAGGRVTLRADQEEGAVCLRVCDTGVGMSPDEVPQALEPFAQGEPVLVRRHSGVGLGLPVTRRLVELHGADIGIETAPGAGTTVHIRFPAARTTAQG